MLRTLTIALCTGAAALAFTVLPAAAGEAATKGYINGKGGAGIAKPGNTGKDDKPQAAEASSKGYINGTGGNGMAKPGGSKTKSVGIKEEGVKR